MQHNSLPLKIFIKKCSANLNTLGPIINKCLFSKHDLLAIVPANLIISELQIKSAVEKAYRSFSSSPISKSISMEFLLFLFATARIDEMINSVEKGSRNAKYYFVVVASEDARQAVKTLRCVYREGFKKTEFELKPCVKKLSKLYRITWLNAYKGVPRRKALEFAIIEKQALLKLGK